MILFDGVCHLCNSFVRFVLQRDGGAHFDFAPLQSKIAQERLGDREFDSVVLLEGTREFHAELAVLRILARLRQPWPWAARLGRSLPGPLLAWGYRLVARYRYAIFGRDEVCALPRPEWKGRFLP